MRDQKVGGQPVLRVFVKGGDDVVRSLLSAGADLAEGAHWVDDQVREVSGGACRLEWAHEPAGPAVTVLEQLEASINGRTPPPTRLVEWAPDVVVLSLQPDAEADGVDTEAHLEAIVRLVKDEVGAHLIVYNCSSVDREDRGSHTASATDPLTLRIHRLNLALVQLSVLEGLSVLDVDRLVAEQGADEHVLGPLRYSPHLYKTIGAEFVRILADYGFFENRPVVPQLGTREAAR